MVFYDYFFSVSFLSMFLVPWHFLPRTIFILDWLEQASCAYICTVSYYFAMLYILVDCVSSLEYPLISYGDYIVLFVIIIHLYMYTFLCMCLKASFVLSTSQGIPSLSMGSLVTIDVLFSPFTCKPPFLILLWSLTCFKLDNRHLMYWTCF